MIAINWPRWYELGTSAGTGIGLTIIHDAAGRWGLFVAGFVLALLSQMAVRENATSSADGGTDGY